MPSDAERAVLLEAIDVEKTYSMPRTKLFQAAGKVHAVKPTNFRLMGGESVGIVGESGSGKTTLCRMLIGQEKPTSGSIAYDGATVQNRGESLKRFRREVQMVFQNPRSSFDPRMTVMQSLCEPLRALRISTNVQDRVKAVLDQVGLSSNAVERYPHEFSGGQLQRLAIARALMPEPKVLIADEPVSALDVSIQAQVLNLLKDLVQELGLSLVMIAHDLAVVGYTTERVYVMSDGEVVEEGEPTTLFSTPQAQQTKDLVGAVLTVEEGLQGRGLA